MLMQYFVAIAEMHIEYFARLFDVNWIALELPQGVKFPVKMASLHTQIEKLESAKTDRLGFVRD